jgi:hypothetical protein
MVHPSGDVHGEPSMNDIDKVKILIRPPELSDNLIGSHLVAKLETLLRKLLIWPSKYLCSYFEVIFTSCKILRHGADSFTSPPNEGALRISIAPKNPLCRPSLNPRTLGKMASTLTITPPRRNIESY